MKLRTKILGPSQKAKLSLERTPSPELKVLKTAEGRTYGSKKRNFTTLSNPSEDFITTDKTSESEKSSNLLNEVSSMPCSAETTPRKKKLERRIIHLKKTLKKKSSLNYRLKKKCTALSRENVIKSILQGYGKTKNNTERSNDNRR